MATLQHLLDVIRPIVSKTMRHGFVLWAALCFPIVTGCQPTTIGSDAGSTDTGPEDTMPDVPQAIPPLPDTLSATGLYSNIASRTLASDVVSYSVRYPLWSDSATKSRYIALPPGTQIDTSDPNAWRFPVGTRIWKEFAIDDQPIETRFFHKIDDAVGGWRWVSYAWSSPDEAIALPAGGADAFGTQHDIPSTDSCFFCHRGSQDIVLGFSPVQLQQRTIDTFVADGFLPAGTQAFEFDVNTTGADSLALGTLHGNCGHCHNPNHIVFTEGVEMELWIDATQPIAAMSPANRTVNAEAGHDLASIPGVDNIVTPGDPDLSQLYVRMNQRGDLQMPPLGTEEIDTAGVRLIRNWIIAFPPGE